MSRIYLDNSATSFPKAEGVAKAMYDFLTYDCSNINRGENESVFSNESKIYNLRAMLSSFYGSKDEDCVFFTLNATDAINTFINGYFEKGDEVLITSYEHNAVVRPLNLHNIPYTMIKCDDKFDLILNDDDVNERTRAIIASGGSNLLGNATDLVALSSFAKRHGLPLFIDTSQASPYLDITLDFCDGVFFTGHKGFLGPQGTGGMVLKREVAAKLRPKNAGGTGSFSRMLTQPEVFPDKFEAGTQNIVGLIGLEAALTYVLNNRKKIYEEAMEHVYTLIKELKDVEGVEIVNPEPKLPLLSLSSTQLDVAELNNYINERYGIEARVGVLCAPLALDLIKRDGVLRLSPSHKTTKEEIAITIKAIKEGVNGLL